jgi:hypothetical protein
LIDLPAIRFQVTEHRGLEVYLFIVRAASGTLSRFPDEVTAAVMAMIDILPAGGGTQRSGT